MQPNLYLTRRAFENLENGEKKLEKLNKLLDKEIVFIDSCLDPYVELGALAFKLFGFRELKVKTGLETKPFFGKIYNEDDEFDGFQKLIEKIDSIDIIQSKDIKQEIGRESRSSIFVTSNTYYFKKLQEEGYHSFLVASSEKISGFFTNKEKAKDYESELNKPKSLTSALIGYGSLLEAIMNDVIFDHTPSSTYITGELQDPKGRFVVIGCGGIGCWNAITLNGQAYLIDFDKYEPNNMNRQWAALLGNDYKASILADSLNRMKGGQFYPINKRIEEVNIEEFDEDFINSNGKSFYGLIFTDNMISRVISFEKLLFLPLNQIIDASCSEWKVHVFKYNPQNEHVIVGRMPLFNQLVNELAQVAYQHNNLEAIELIREYFGIDKPRNENIRSCGEVGTPSIVSTNMIAAGASNLLLNSQKKKYFDWSFGGFYNLSEEGFGVYRMRDPIKRIRNILGRLYG